MCIVYHSSQHRDQHTICFLKHLVKSCNATSFMFFMKDYSLNIYFNDFYFVLDTTLSKSEIKITRQWPAIHKARLELAVWYKLYLLLNRSIVFAHEVLPMNSDDD